MFQIRGRPFSRVETRPISTYSSLSSVTGTGDRNILLTVDTSSLSSSSSGGYSGCVNAGVESDRDSETGTAAIGQLAETLLRQPVSSSVSVSKSDVHLGHTLNYNGPVTIKLSLQQQSEHHTTTSQSESQPEPQPLNGHPSQEMPQIGQWRRQELLSHIQPKTQFQPSPQQQLVSQPQTQNQIQDPPQQQPLAQSHVLAHTQQNRRERILSTKQPEGMLQRNMEMAYGQDFRTVKPSGCQLIAAELARKGQLTGLIRDVGADVVQSCCERNMAFIVLLVVLVMVCGISLSLVVGYRRNASPSRPSVNTTVKGTSPNELNTENPQNITVAVGQETGSTTTTEKQISDKSTIATEKTNSGQTYNYNSQTKFVRTTSAKPTTTTETQFSDKPIIATEKTNSGQTYNYNSQTKFVQTTSAKPTTTTETQISGPCKRIWVRRIDNWGNIHYHICTICDFGGL
ncbi:uncharacterized protein LOC126260197 isoform X2 [Schistocerca nitens]|uniref:uncharacterized protein LOC126260197 isoform X2 n=1 Tax=Schistocerca nitens TaxID=7011 RepID=UPI00211828B7|nr:uncharacterized protein LOC126260197 isoform X2 [Schistocerca nitens]